MPRARRPTAVSHIRSLGVPGPLRSVRRGAADADLAGDRRRRRPAQAPELRAARVHRHVRLTTLTGRREPVCHAAMLEPHAAGELPLDEIRALVDALLEAHGDWLPRLAPGALAPTR